MRPSEADKLPPLAAILVFTGRAAAGIAGGAGIALFVVSFAKLAGLPFAIHDLRQVGDAALAVLSGALAVMGACVLFAWYADRKRGL